ncbi:hypothetical protein P7K49_028999 [Saguinus oedipus]|uniref:Protein phosphatase 1 regulatory subunit 21 C-terminal domain-containing protein n=1 Tax=Saguinus oedipus TaxID=9490 RepID=A0ABQ9U5Y9_SAGOE|nr:hypothetical protein P7K49_028999 [Saguinus oedipus]
MQLIKEEVEEAWLGVKKLSEIKYSQYNALNVPLHNRRHQVKDELKMRDIAGQALAFVQDLVTALLNFHTYTEQRIQIFPVDSAIDTISPLNQKLSEDLDREDTLLHDLEEECESSLCTSALRARNLELSQDMKKMTAVFEKLQTYIALLALPRDSNQLNPDGLLRTNYSSVLTNVGAALHGFHDVMKGLKLGLYCNILGLETVAQEARHRNISKHYSQKATIEHELPTATQKLVTTNDCILSSVVALTNGAGKTCVEIASFFSNNLDYFIASLSYGPKAASGFISPLSAECMLQYKKKAATYMKSLRKVFFFMPLLESVPYEEALANRRILLSSTESREGLAQQVQQSLEKISKLEQEKEHWMLEAQLAKIKLEKENQRIADKLKSTSSGQLVGLAQENAAVSNAAGQDEATAKAVSEPIQSTSLESSILTYNNTVPDVESREDLIKNHYMARIVELTSQLQLADSKSVHFYAEEVVTPRMTLLL